VQTSEANVTFLHSKIRQAVQENEANAITYKTFPAYIFHGITIAFLKLS